MNALRMTRLKLWCVSIGLMTIVLIAIAAYFVRSNNTTLEDGLRFVEVADSDGVDRVEQRLKHLGKNDEATVLRAAWLVKRGRYEQALDVLPQSLAEGPYRHKVLLMVAESLFRLDELSRAESILQTLINESRDQVEAHRMLAAIHYDLGSPGKALKSLEEVFRLAPDDYRPHRLAGVILKDNENFQSAAGQLILGLGKDPPEEIQREMREDLIEVLIRIGEFQAGLDATSDAEATSIMLTRRAECFWSLGQREEAIKLIEQVLPDDPQNVEALKLKAKIIEDDGRTNEALTLLERAVSIAPNDLEARYQLVQIVTILKDEKRRAKEQAEYDRYRALQDSMVKLNQDADANPDDPEIRFELARVCEQLHRPHLASMWQRAAKQCERRKMLKTPR